LYGRKRVMGKVRILVLDDDTEILQLIRRTLEMEGYNVDAFPDGDSALTFLKKKKEDLILLDIMMPGIDGYQVLRQIRQDYNIPVIMLTAISDVDAIEKSVELGADGYITKPFRTEELLARVRAILRRSQPK
jgi:DNA-binding response OmpR family regulator